MFGRRSHPRLRVTSPWDGAIEVLRDVVLNRVAEDELVAVSNNPAAIGEEMSLDLLSEGASVAMRVRVLDCRPVMVNGSVRHQLQLRVVTVPQISPAAGAAQV